MNDQFDLRRALELHLGLAPITRLTAEVAHDLSNTLQVIRGYASFARDSLPEGSAARADLDHVIDAADRAGELTGHLQQFVRDTDSSDNPDVVEVLASLRSLLLPFVGERVRVTTRLPESPLVADCCDATLRRALLALCVNAVEAMPDGGELRLLAERVDGDLDAASIVGAAPNDPVVRIRVCDTGSGVPAQVTNRVFEPLLTTRETDHPATAGVGHVLISSFVARSGGGVALESTPGEGSTFTLLLPIATGGVGSARVDNRAPVYGVSVGPGGDGCRR